MDRIKSCSISVLTKFRGHYSGEVEQQNIRSVAGLREHFTMFKRQGELFGYVVEKNRKPGWNDGYIYKVQVIIRYENIDGPQEKKFDELKQLVDFLNKHDDVAACLAYVRKS